jgi:hypothetical protein
MSENKLKDENSNLLNSHPLRLIGAGLFLWLCVRGYGYIVDKIVRDAGLLSGLDPVLIYWLKMAIELIAMIIFVIFIIGRFQKKYQNNPMFLGTFFIRLVVLYILSQVLQFLYTFYVYQMVPVAFFDALLGYDMELYSGTVLYQTLDIIPELALTVFCGVYLFRGDRLIQKKNIKNV